MEHPIFYFCALGIGGQESGAGRPERCDFGGNQRRDRKISGARGRFLLAFGQEIKLLIAEVEEGFDEGVVMALVRDRRGRSPRLIASRWNLEVTVVAELSPGIVREKFLNADSFSFCVKEKKGADFRWTDARSCFHTSILTRKFRLRKTLASSVASRFWLFRLRVAFSSGVAHAVLFRDRPDLGFPGCRR